MLQAVLGLLALFAVAWVIVTFAGTLALLNGLLHPDRRTFAWALARNLPTDPGEMGLAFESLRLTLSDGSETPAWLIAGQRPHPGGPLVVLIHGFGDSRYGVLPWVPLIVPYASQVLVYDLRGHGEAESTHATCGTKDVRDVHAILDQVAPDRPVVLFGCSMGAGIAIAAGARQLPSPWEGQGKGTSDHSTSSSRSARPVIASTPTQPPPEGKEIEIARILGVIADGPYRHWDEPIKCYLRNRRYPTQPWTLLAGLLLRAIVPGFADFDRLGHAKRLPCPLLVLHGSGDHICPFTSAKELADAAPKGRLVEFEQGGHLDLAVVDEAKYCAALASFFDALEPRQLESPRRQERQVRGEE